MKEACKGGLTVGREEDWIHLAGRGWKTIIKESNMPNKTKGTLLRYLESFRQAASVTGLRQKRLRKKKDYAGHR